jgi:hypothetical protein
MKRPAILRDPSRAELQRFGVVPRDVRLTSGGRVVAVFAVLLAAAAVTAALGLPILRMSQQAERDYFDLERVVADALITGVRIDRDDEDRRRVVTYRYAAPGGEYEGRVELEMRNPRETVEGGRLRIVYLPSEPKRSWLQGRGRPGVMPMWLLPVVPMGFLLSAAGMAWGVRRQRILLSEGRFTTARVTSYKKVQGSHGHSYRVTYEFTTLSGAKVTAKTDRTLPQDTTTVAVVYHRENPRWNAIYPLSLAVPARELRP